jgi:hypothetical protein
MNEDRKLSTSDLVDAADRAERRRIDVTDDAPGPRTDVRDDDRHDTPRRDAGEPHEPLFVAADAEGYRTRWGAIQTGFVDEPRRAVEEADALVAEVVKRLAEGFSGERQRLEADWERNDQVSTEDLRQAMRRYRSFFERLLNV